jgi:hypothetical protein
MNKTSIIRTCPGCDAKIDDNEILAHVAYEHRRVWDALFNENSPDDNLVISELWRLERRKNDRR